MFPGVEELAPEAVRAAMREEVTRATASRTSREHIRLITVLQEPYSPENGCLVTPPPRPPLRAHIHAHSIMLSIATAYHH